MAKIIFEFANKEDKDKWLAAYYNSGEQEIAEYWAQDGEDMPDIKITEEEDKVSSKYLYISSGSECADYAAVSFEQDFKGSRLELWEKANKAGEQLDYEDGDLYFGYEAMELDDRTVEQMQERMDYDDSKHGNYFKVEE